MEALDLRDFVAKDVSKRFYGNEDEIIFPENTSCTSALKKEEKDINFGFKITEAVASATEGQQSKIEISKESISNNVLFQN